MALHLALNLKPFNWQNRFERDCVCSKNKLRSGPEEYPADRSKWDQNSRKTAYRAPRTPRTLEGLEVRRGEGLGVRVRRGGEPRLQAFGCFPFCVL